MRNSFLLALTGCLLSLPAFASSACYSPAELQAEQLLRLHSELMVITVTCRTGSQGENLVPAYTGFTHNNIVELHNAEQTMIRYYEAQGASDGTEKLDKLRTKLGNEFGQKMADMSAPAFCGEYRDRVLSFYEKSPDSVVDEAKRMTVAEHSYVHPCNDGTRVARKNQ